MRAIEQAVSEVARELQVRQRCYPRWIQDGKMDQVDAIDRAERLEAALHYLREYERLVAKLDEPKSYP